MLPSATHRPGRPLLAILLAAGLAQSASADILSWNAGAGTWSNVNNWTPLGQPFPLDTARVGNLAGIANNTVTLNVHATVTAFTIQNGMTLRTNQNRFSVIGLAQITGQNTVGSTLFPSTIRVQSNGNYDEFSTDQLTVSNGGRLWLNGSVGAIIDSSATLQSQGSLYGSGIVTLGGAGTVFTNDGNIHATPGGMSLIATAGGRIDLDGTSGNGEVFDDSQDATGIMIAAPGLTDSFGGTIHLTSNARLIMNLSEGWTADANSTITVEGIIDLQPRPAAHLAGFPATLAGDVSVEGFSGHLIVDASTILQPTLALSIGTQDTARFAGSSTINGGDFNIAQGGNLTFSAPTIHGGSFHTFSNLITDGAVTFGLAEWSGSITINGIGRQDNSAEVTGPTSITANAFDMDGADGDVIWDIGNTLTVNASQIDTTTASRFDGTINVAGGIVPKLTVNLPAPAGWIMAGTMNLRGQTVLFEERLAGSPVDIQGAVNVETGKVRISAPTTFSSPASVAIGPATSLLVMGGQSHVESGANFSGLGTLQVSTTGAMTLDHGASLGPIGLVNQGQLDIGAAAGTVSVDRFQNAAQGTWRVSIGGHIAGSQHDLLLVSGGAATLAGSLSVELIDAGVGFFQPQLNDQFTILTALGGVSGTFAANPVTITPAGTYQWTVLYQPNSVVLRLTGFTPVACYANCDASTTPPILNVNDFTCFLNKYAAGASYANCDQSTAAPVLNVNDFTCFLNRYAAGCP